MHKETEPEPEYDYSPNVPLEEMRFLEQRILKILSLNKEGTIFSREQRKKQQILNNVKTQL